MLVLALSTTLFFLGASPPKESTLSSLQVVQALEQHRQNLAASVEKSVVLIKSESGTTGTGFFITADGVLLTTRSAVGDDDDVTVFFHDGRNFPGTVIERLPGERRLVMIRVPQSGLPFLRLTSGMPMGVGRMAYVFGRDLQSRLTFHTGMVMRDAKEEPVFFLQLQRSEEDAGRPILDATGRVVGILLPTEIGNSDAVALAIEEAPKQLEKVTPLCDCLVVRAPPNVPIYVDGKVRGQGPELVLMVDREPHSVYAVVNGKMRKKKVRYPDHRIVDLRR